MTPTPELKKEDFWYDLPDERIAKFPLEQRDASKLLVYQNGEINHGRFTDLVSYLPANSILVFNNTKVIPARLIFQRATGAWIEIFLLKPTEPSTLIQRVMEETHTTSWETLIGNLKRWKDGESLITELALDDEVVTLTATLIDREQRLVRLDWDKGAEFARVVESAGKTPLPPYLNREVTDIDRERYQTIYSKNHGAVAAPTAGLHFTNEILASLSQKGVSMDYITLHVGAGTFRPISSENVTKHPMHGEQMVFTQDNLRNILNAEGKIVAVGTTSMRSLESLYWYGVKLIFENDTAFHIPQDYPYQFDAKTLPDYRIVIQRVLDWMMENNLEQLEGETSIYIYPGYTFRIVSGLVTNFHQPGSTLILLVAAFIGGDWKGVYENAMQNGYRFLSYGDSSLLWRSTS